MSVATGDVVTMIFTTTNPATGAAADADSLPTGVLWLAGVANGATVTIADATGTGKYSFAVTMPTLTTGQRVQVAVDATIGGVACAGVVWEDQATPAVSLAANAVTAAALATDAVEEIADGVWDEATSGHTTAGSFGKLVIDIATVVSTLNSKAGAWTGTGVNTFLGAFKALLSKSATLPTDIGGTFDPAADSTEAISEAVASVLDDTGTSGVVLANDAITAGKFDESTAFPLKAADAGSTYVARTGADGDTLETLSDQIDGVGGATGSGAISFPVTVNDESSNPIDGVEVWISTDSAGASVVAGTLHTSALGVATFMLDAGTYYLWRQKSGYNFTNPVTIVVS